ncbi:MAG: hypothetical protein BroJett007_10970 [Chloroflexota bacterium]|nr:MAG: hypothetical protein BroJett007_10970 [Chloroflexota bacterium]
MAIFTKNSPAEQPNAMEFLPKWAKTYFRILFRILPFLGVVYMAGQIHLAVSAYLGAHPNQEIIFELIIALWFILSGTILYGVESMGMRNPNYWRHLELYSLALFIIALNPILTATAIDKDLNFQNLLRHLSTGTWEEAAFRGFFLAACLSFTKTRFSLFGILIIGIFFGLWHFDQDPAVIVYKCCLGFTFAAIAIRTNTIVPLMVIHATHNGLLEVLNSDGLSKIALVSVGLLTLVVCFSHIKTTWTDFAKLAHSRSSLAHKKH